MDSLTHWILGRTDQFFKISPPRAGLDLGVLVLVGFSLQKYVLHKCFTSFRSITPTVAPLMRIHTRRVNSRRNVKRELLNSRYAVDATQRIFLMECDVDTPPDTPSGTAGRI